MTRVKKGTALQDWMVETGTTPEALAVALGKTTFAIRHWLRGDGWPEVGAVCDLIKLSKGALTFESIVESTATAEQKRRLK